MPTITEDRARSRARRATISKSAQTILNESTRDFNSFKTYDVFLSHSTKDAEVVLGIKLILEDHRRSVYVDWIEDPNLDRTKVTPGTAETLRKRMRSCLSLVYVHSTNSGASKWMPWELGYFDGYKGAVAILPVTKNEETSFEGQEYLGIYPWIDESGLSLKELRIRRSISDYKNFQEWTGNAQAFRKTS